MRILQVTATFPPSINGVAITVDNLKKELENLGHEVIVLAPQNKSSRLFEKNVIRYSSLFNPLLSDYPIPLIPNINVVRKLLKNKKPDIIHVHHPFHIGYFAKSLAKSYSIPLVFTYHTRYEIYLKQYLPFLSEKFRQILFNKFVIDFCKETDLIISPLKSITDNLLQKILYLNIITLPSGTSELAKINLSKEKIKEKLGIPKNKKVLLTINRLSKEKNLSLLVKSIGRLNDNFLLLIVGGGPYEGEIRDIVYSENLADKVRFIGLIKHFKLGIYYQAADYFVYPSITETQGLVFLEALQFGVPIVAVDSEASREWVSENIGIRTKNNPNDFANGILNLENRNLAKMSWFAKNFAKKYSKEKVTKKILNEYNRLIEQNYLRNKFYKTGWQSWSPRTKTILKIPVWNYPPKPDDYLPSQSKRIYRKKSIKGWCSWYAFGYNISEDKILKQAKWFVNHRDLPVKYILIDDGWNKHGDWAKADKNKFPRGIKYVRNRLQNIGFKAGIWIAPFIVDPKSELFQANSQWIVKGRLFYSDGVKGFPLDRIFFKRFILDVRKAKVKKYLFDCLDYLILECGFELLKLDYLYAIYFIPKISAREAGFILRNFLFEIKQRYPKVYTIACGSPLKPAIGIVDSMRITPDVISPPLMRLPIIKNIFNTYKLKLVLNNVRKRLWTREFWNLDPDVFVCSPNLGIADSKIIELQKTIKLAKGNILLGDDMRLLLNSRVEKFIKPLF